MGLSESEETDRADVVKTQMKGLDVLSYRSSQLYRDAYDCFSYKISPSKKRNKNFTSAIQGIIIVIKNATKKSSLFLGLDNS